MGLKPSNPKTTRSLAPEGSFPARCVAVIDLGTQLDAVYGTQKRKILFMWELPTKKTVFKEEVGEEPFVVNARYTNTLASMGTFRPMLKAWLGKDLTKEEEDDFDPTALVGKECLIQIIHNEAKDGSGNMYANVSNASQLPEGMDCPFQITPSRIFDLDNWSQEVFDSLPEFVRNTIMKSKEYVEDVGLKTGGKTKKVEGNYAKPTTPEEPVDLNKVGFGPSDAVNKAPTTIAPAIPNNTQTNTPPPVVDSTTTPTKIDKVIEKVKNDKTLEKKADNVDISEIPY